MDCSSGVQVLESVLVGNGNRTVSGQTQHYGLQVVEGAEAMETESHSFIG